MNDYIEQACRTKSDKFYGDRVPLIDFRLCLAECIAALRALDEMKKAIFYGRSYNGTNGTYGPNINRVLASVAETHQGTREQGCDILHSIIGSATEAGEKLEHLLNVANGMATFDAVNWKEETGDSQWYDAIGCAALGLTFEDVQATNIAKLRKRFPEKFTEDSANTRDLFAEREILEK